MAGILDFLKSFDALFKSIGILAALGAALYWVLQKQVEASLARRLEKTKSDLGVEVEKAKHELQIEYTKKSIVFEHQKDSFKRVLVGMHQAIQEIEQGGLQHAISWNSVDAFRRIIPEECLFLDSDGDRALRAFIDAMRSASEYSANPTQEGISWAHSRMTFIFERLADHFRSRVGLLPGTVHPLFDVELLGACSLVNRFLPNYLPEKAQFEFRDRQTASEVVANAKQHLVLLKAGLVLVRDGIRSDDETAIEVERYLSVLNKATADTKAKNAIAEQ